MSRVEEIEAAIDSLPPAEYRRIVQWVRSREQERWDDQLDSDSQGSLRDWPPPEWDRQQPGASGLYSELCRL